MNISHVADSIGLKEMPRYEVKIIEEDDWMKGAHVAKDTQLIDSIAEKQSQIFSEKCAHPMVHGGMGVATSAYPMTESVLSSSMRHGGMLGHYSGSSTTSADKPKIGLICLRCRRRGHRAKNCPEVQVGSNYDKYCYNCGETGHSLANCPHHVQEGGTKFAECFVCKQQGHLSKNCPQNAHGIYPKGGCCKICGGVTHLVRDCPEKGLLRNEQRPCGTVTKFVSGDDIEDDFMIDDINNRDKDKSSKSKDGQAKPKKGPKVVNFS
ncbi:hypothetical protein Ahy_A06g025872 [Arachis hypogaea]|uniref:CCHC-type domain-containing protein n=1 Tax=Arachis hypogaea TaxID=3818 RepID=A0A445CIV7_ARAHY|nr:hypothetical protein Ahy_A06g025872 [Arachis hypogaea]